MVGVSARTRGDVKIAASQLGAELGRYIAEVARSQRWPRRGALTPAGPDYSSPSAFSMRTVLRIAVTVSSSSGFAVGRRDDAAGMAAQIDAVDHHAEPHLVHDAGGAVALERWRTTARSGSNLVGVIGARSGFVKNSSDENVP